MTQVGEGIAVTQVKDPEEDHWAQLEYTYPDGSPVQGMFTAVDGSGMTWTGYLNDQGQACLSGLPAGSVEYQLLPSDSLEDELQELRIQIQTVLDGIIEEQRAEAKAHQEELGKQSTLGKTYSHTAAVGRGLWNGAIGLLTFVKDVAVKAGEVAVYLSPVTRMNNLLQASYTSYRNGELNWAQWRESLAKNYQEEEFKDLADLLGIDIRNLDKEEVLAIITEAYETVAYIADDAEFRELFIQFGKDYAGAQSSIEWAEFAGGGLFEIVLTALLLAFTGGLGNAAQIASKVRHAARLRTLGGMLRKLGKLLQRKKLNKKTKGGVDSKHKLEAEKPEGQKLVANDSKPKVVGGQGSRVQMDGHKIYDSNYSAISTNPTAQYRFSDPSYRSTGNDVYFGENSATAYFEVRKNIKGKSLFVGEVEVDNMLDLTDPEIIKNMNIDQKVLIAKVDNPAQQKAVYGYTNEIANQAYDAGYNGIIYSSSRKDGNNKAVVLFGGRYNPNDIKAVLDRPIK